MNNRKIYWKFVSPFMRAKASFFPFTKLYNLMGCVKPKIHLTKISDFVSRTFRRTINILKVQIYGYILAKLWRHDFGIFAFTLNRWAHMNSYFVIIIHRLYACICIINYITLRSPCCSHFPLADFVPCFFSNAQRKRSDPVFAITLYVHGYSIPSY